jgi:hypothetical protein
VAHDIPSRVAIPWAAVVLLHGVRSVRQLSWGGHVSKHVYARVSAVTLCAGDSLRSASFGGMIGSRIANPEPGGRQWQTPALFVGWGRVVRGREAKSIEVFNEACSIGHGCNNQVRSKACSRCTFDTHAGDQAAFVLLRGDRDKLSRLWYSEGWQRLTLRAGMVVESRGS